MVLSPMNVFDESGRRRVVDEGGSTSLSCWIVRDEPAANTQAVATKAAVAGESHYIVGMMFGCSASPTANWWADLLDGATAVWKFYILSTTPFVVLFPRAVKLTAGNAASARIAALGAGVVGIAHLIGYTK